MVSESRARHNHGATSARRLMQEATRESDRLRSLRDALGRLEANRVFHASARHCRAALPFEANVKIDFPETGASTKRVGL